MIAVIPARRGSQSIPGKNHRELAGKPLVAWVIEAAMQAVAVKRVVVTTDDPSVASIAHRLCATVHARSPETATDTAPTEAALLEVARDHPAEAYVLLQATSPLTTAADIDEAIDTFVSGGFDSLLSVVPQLRFAWRREPDGLAAPINYEPANRPRRQDAEPLLVENGAIYVYRRTVLEQQRSRLGGRIGLFRMSPDTYHEADEPDDWSYLDGRLRARTAGTAA